MNKTQLITFIMFLYTWSMLNGQSSSDKYLLYKNAELFFESQKDPDHVLVNGRLLMPSRIKVYGHPYLGEDKFMTGDITISNRKFKDILLKYDILEQQIVISYTFEGNTTRSLILNNEFIGDFTLNKKHFVHKEIPGLGRKYLQELAGDQVTCYYYFYKREEEKAESRYLVKQIHPTKLYRYIKLGDEYYRYRSRRSFLKVFDEKYRSDIKKYIKSRKLAIKGISDDDMIALLNFCAEQLSNE